MEVEAIIPSLIASIVGYTLHGGLMGFGPMFGAHPTLELGAPIQLAYYAGLGLLAGLGGLLYARTFYGITDAFPAARRSEVGEARPGRARRRPGRRRVSAGPPHRVRLGPAGDDA